MLLLESSTFIKVTLFVAVFKNVKLLDKKLLLIDIYKLYPTLIKESRFDEHMVPF